jgi:putative DNA primase/helicase
MLSNELQPQALDNTDRRYLVIFTPQALDAAFYKALGVWRSSGGLEAWYHYLLHYELDGFDPYAPAPATEAKQDLIELNRKTPERFWLEWSGGELGLPYHSCAVDQVYRAYGKYCQRVGDRFPMQKPVFSRMLVRMADSMRRTVRVKSMKPTMPDGAERTTRMLLITEPTLGPGESEGEWASATVAAFEKALRTYLHGPHSPENEDIPGGRA